MSIPKIGITIGDINGIGPEVIIKTLGLEYVLKRSIPIIYGSSKVIAYHKNIVDDPGFSFVSCNSPESASIGKVNVINCWNDNVKIDLGQATTEGGECAHIALDRAIGDLISGELDALVTAPINKHAMKMANFPHLGHTEFIASKTGMLGSELMIMSSEELKVAVLSSHVPLSQASEIVSKDRLFQCILTLNESLKMDFGIEKPTIAVLGLNPHSGDNGEIGSEEEEIIKPILIELKERGLLVSGPYAADGFFGRHLYSKFDAVLAMYHDQGLIPFKSLSHGKGMNFTAGLTVVRTSPDHGTAYELAGKNESDPSSFRFAYFEAISIINQRREYLELTGSKIEKIQLESEKGDEGVDLSVENE